jgi:Flp pilus assembly protein CpaB
VIDVRQARTAGRPAWVNLRSTLGLILFAVAFIAGARVLNEARVTTPVWTAARDLPSGTEVGPSDVVSAAVRLPSPLLERYARTSTDLNGAVLSRPVRAGEMIALDWLARDLEDHPGRAMTIPLTPESGAAPTGVRVGDRLDVLLTLDAGDVRARTLVLAGNVEVLEVVETSGLVGEESSVVGVMVAVTPQQEVRLAFGIRTGDIDLSLVEGGPSPAPAESVSAEDFE